jgi:phosphoenolpyruvate carboxylase
VVDEHNLDEVSRFLHIRHNMENAQEVLTNELTAIKKEKADKEAYLEKVKIAAEKYAIDTEGKTTEQVVAEVKAKQQEAKATSEKK